MRFGRVEGVVVPVEGENGPRLRPTVYLETGAGLGVVREETVGVLRPLGRVEDVIWHAGQLTQETIGIDLAARGWEVIGAGEVPPPEPGALARSASYAVRRMG